MFALILLCTHHGDAPKIRVREKGEQTAIGCFARRVLERDTKVATSFSGDGSSSRSFLRFFVSCI